MSAPTPNALIEGDLRISVLGDGLVLYLGTAAQLQFDGLISNDFEWPRADVEKRWKLNQLEYWLCRERPHGHKGPKSSWSEVDNWRLYVQFVERDFLWLKWRDIERKRDDLRRDIYHLSPAGRIDLEADFFRRTAAREDIAFQTFKAKFVPQRKRPGRKPTIRQAGQ